MTNKVMLIAVFNHPDGIDNDDVIEVPLAVFDFDKPSEVELAKELTVTLMKHTFIKRIYTEAI